MTTKLSLGTTSHSHRCVICEAEIPCDNPEDAQDCLWVRPWYGMEPAPKKRKRRQD